MAIFIGILSQKGGVSKSTLARLLAREYANSGWKVKIADMDVSQGTSCEWARMRMASGIIPEIAAEQFTRVSRVMEQSDQYNLIIFDGAPHSTNDTLNIARESDLVILPTGFSLDDLKPTIKLAHELKKAGIEKKRIVLAFMRTGDSKAEYKEASDYVSESEYYLLDGYIQERTAYRRAMDRGLALTETRFSTLNNKADELVQAIENRLNNLTKRGENNG